MDRYPLKIKDDTNLVQKIQPRDILIYSEHPELLKENLQLGSFYFVKAKKENGFILSCFAQGENFVESSKLINDDYWHYLPLPEEVR